MAEAQRHPTDTERAAAARPTLAALLRALGADDADGVAALLRDDAVWLGPDGRAEGEDARRRARAFCTDGLGRRWTDPQQHGAHAVLRWGSLHTGALGALVIEIRGDAVVLVCEAP
jgi:hypothetical protein